jgi:hypothetical protein
MNVKARSMIPAHPLFILVGAANSGWLCRWRPLPLPQRNKPKRDSPATEAVGPCRQGRPPAMERLRKASEAASAGLRARALAALRRAV